MTKLLNEITIAAPAEKIYEILADLEVLDKYDPTVAKSSALPGPAKGIGAKRKVTMQDGKNWFEEKITAAKTGEQITYTLTDCSFPIAGLSHSYELKKSGTGTLVRQTMQYTVKFGILGKLMDFLMIKKQTSAGIKKFFRGLKTYAEK